jgi:hypothetical protein
MASSGARLTITSGSAHEKVEVGTSQVSSRSTPVVTADPIEEVTVQEMVLHGMA